MESVINYRLSMKLLSLDSVQGERLSLRLETYGREVNLRLCVLKLCSRTLRMAGFKFMYHKVPRHFLCQTVT
jgi:hypothetical protein